VEALRLCETKMPVDSNEVTRLKLWMRKRVGLAPKIEDAAKALGCSERTLRRRLLEVGTSYRAVHDALREERARALLRDTRLAIAEIGTQLGYSDDREFRRAYKRWTGQVPSAARK
ncbi:MAG: helix-turn-helix transcriptional regulator, partial [Chthoniobacterales bacterium]